MRAPRRTQARTEIRMQYRPLGRSDLRVSHIGLGTMTWGEQNDEAQAHEQLDAALAAGVNFVDTAEMYPVAPRAETYGRTEQIIGSWLARTARRHDIILARDRKSTRLNSSH